MVIVYGDFAGAGGPGDGLPLPEGESYIAYDYLIRDGGSVPGYRGSRNAADLQYALRGIALPTPRLAPSFPESQDRLVARLLAGNPVQTVAQSRTVAGWTATVGRAYADRNRVVLTYRVSGPAREVSAAWPTLQTADGRPLPAIGHGRDGRSGQTETVAWFDSSGIIGDAADGHLHLVIPSIQARPNPPTPTPPRCDPTELTPVTWDPRSPPTHPPSVATASPAGDITAGPFVFDFVVPVVPATPLPTVPPPIPTAVRPLIAPLPMQTQAAPPLTPAVPSK